MAYEFVLKKKPAFHEIDMAGIAHFSNFFRWMEETEHAFMISLGLLPLDLQGQVFYGWPRVHVSCEYRSPLRFGDEFQCRLLVEAVKNTSVTFVCVFHKLEASVPNRLVAKGTMTCVYGAIDMVEKSITTKQVKSVLQNRVQVAPEKIINQAISSKSK